jgi:hypothetical protein
MLRRIGLESLCADGAELPPYYDEQYGCQMEVLRFDSRSPSPKYRDWVDYFTASLADAPVICPDRDRHSAHFIPAGSRIPSIDSALLPGLLQYPGMA